VCGDGFDIADSEVVCRQLGYPGSSPIAYSSDYYGQGSGQIWLTRVSCSGNETKLSDCESSGFGLAYYCVHNQDVGVNCRDPSTASSDGDVRLSGSHSTTEGRVEIYYNGYWGTVCNEGFDLKDAEVVCRQLGFSDFAVIPYSSNDYGEGSGYIWLANIDCDGSESYLSECTSWGWGLTYYCSHKQDVGVNCSKYLYMVRFRVHLNI
jgi:hypothetical protein